MYQAKARGLHIGTRAEGEDPGRKPLKKGEDATSSDTFRKGQEKERISTLLFKQRLDGVSRRYSVGEQGFT